MIEQCCNQGGPLVVTIRNNVALKIVVAKRPESPDVSRDEVEGNIIGFEQKHITPKRITLSQSSGFLGNQSKFTS